MEKKKEEKTGCIIMLYLKAHCKVNDRCQFRVKGQKKVLKACRPREQASVAFLISNQIDFK